MAVGSCKLKRCADCNDKQHLDPHERLPMSRLPFPGRIYHATELLELRLCRKAMRMLITPALLSEPTVCAKVKVEPRQSMILFGSLVCSQQETRTSIKIEAATFPNRNPSNVEGLLLMAAAMEKAFPGTQMGLCADAAMPVPGTSHCNMLTTRLDV